MTKYSPLFFLLFLVACSEQESKEVVSIKEIYQENLKIQYVQVNAQNLRLRKNPDLQAPILESVPANTLLEYLKDSTKFKTEVIHNNVKYNDRWYYIKSPKGVKGWVFGGLIKFLSLKENSYILQNKQNALQLQEALKVSQKDSVNTRQLKEFKLSIAQLNKQKISSVKTALNLYKKEIEPFNAQTNDYGYDVFYKFLCEVTNFAQKKYDLQAYQHLKDEIKNYGQINLNIDAFCKDLKRNGLQFCLEENQLIICQNYELVLRHFYKNVTPSMRTYMDIQERNLQQNWISDQQLNISLKELALQILDLYRLKISAPQFIYQQDVHQRLKQQLNVLFNGTNKRPAFASNILTQDYKEIYEWIANNYPNHNLGIFFSRYFNLLQKEEFRRTNSVENTINELINNL